MKALVDRIFIYGGLEYRLKKGQNIDGLPKNVKNQLLALNLASDEHKQTKRTGRRKK